MILLLFALLLTAGTVVIHGVGTLEALAHLAGMRQRRKQKLGPMMQALQVVRAVGILLALHIIEACAWAVFYVLAEALPDFETSVYYSMTSYTTVGYGDVLLPDDWRLLGPIEAAVGILMFGWSTAIIVAIFTRVYSEPLRSLMGPEEQRQ
jgi:voltage-gated potassium channel Kch